MNKKILLTFLLLFVLVFVFQNLIAQKRTLKIGDKVPDFSLINQNGEKFNLNQVIGKSNLVIYFYPKDDTPGCTKEACKFRDEFEVFNELQAQVIGISSDDVKSHKAFAEKYQLPFLLLSDTDKKVRKLFGVPKFAGIFPGRVTYIIDKKGKIVYIFNSMQKAEKHISEAKKILQELKSK